MCAHTCTRTHLHLHTCRCVRACRHALLMCISLRPTSHLPSYTSTCTLPPTHPLPPHTHSLPLSHTSTPSPSPTQTLILPLTLPTLPTLCKGSSISSPPLVTVTPIVPYQRTHSIISENTFYHFLPSTCDSDTNSPIALRYASISRSLLPYNRSLLTLTHTSSPPLVAVAPIVLLPPNVAVGDSFSRVR